MFFSGGRKLLCVISVSEEDFCSKSPLGQFRSNLFLLLHIVHACMHLKEQFHYGKKKKLQDFCYSGEGFCSAQDLSGRLIFAQLCAGLCANQYSTSQLVRANTQEPDLPSRRGFILVLWASSFDMGGRECRTLCGTKAFLFWQKSDMTTCWKQPSLSP